MTRDPKPAAGRVLALDIGLRRTGIALSDPSRTLASPLDTVSLGLRALVSHLCDLIREHGVTLVVVGHPELRSGRPTQPAQLAEAVAERLRRRGGVEVRFWEEALTSWEAETLLGRSAAEGHRGRRSPRAGRRWRTAKGTVDRVAATLILQDFLNACRDDRPDPREAE